MYRCPKLVDVPVVLELPTGMYKTPMFNVITDFTDTSPSLCKSSPQTSVLEARQEAVLDRLRTLKEQLDRLQSTRVTAAAAATSASVAPTLGAAAHSSPAKRGGGGGGGGGGGVEGKRREFLQVATTLEGHLTDLNEIHLYFSSKGQTGDLLRQQESVLYRLGRLKERLGQLSVEKDCKSVSPDEEPLTLAERHRGVLEVISALREEMKFLAELQKWMDEREEATRAEGKRRKKEEEEVEEEELEKHHRHVLHKLDALKVELKAMVERMRKTVEVEAESDLLFSVCGCLSADPRGSDASDHPSSTSLHPSASSLHPTDSSSKAVSLSSSSSSTSSTSLLALLPPPPSPLPSSSSSSSCKTEYTSGKHIQDLVISASPSTPPLSLLLLRRLLAQAGCPVYMASRLHSSVARVNQELQEAFSDSPLGDRTSHTLAFSLQWSDASTPSLMVSPLRQTKIAGEVNIVRYVSRLFPAASPFNYEATGTYAAIADVDQLLDTLERELVWGGGKERQAALRSVAVRLARSPFLCGDLCGVADVVAWSLVRQKGVVASGHKEVVSWLAKMDAMAGIDIDNILQQQKQNKTQQTKANASKNSTTGGGGGGVSVSAKVEEKRNLAPKGGKHLGRKELQTYLEELGISYQVREHKEVFTVEELMEQVRGIPGVVTKNLFLRDKKKKLYLLSTRHDTEVDLKTVANQVGTKDLRFADETILLDTLGVRQGCVSALALANDTSSHLVQFLVERSALDPSVPFINFHPMSNAATLGLTPADLEKFLVATGHPPTFVTFQ